MKVFVWGGLVVAALAVGAVVAFSVGGQDEDTQCFAAFDSSAAAEAAAAEGRTAGFDVSHQPGHDRRSFIFETGKSGDEAIPLERSFDRIVLEHHGHFGGSAHCVEHSAFD
jgi:hypothetical protein